MPSKLLAVLAEDDEMPVLGPRQLLVSGHNGMQYLLDLIVEPGCESPPPCPPEFMKHWDVLSESERSEALEIDQKALFARLPEAVSCVGCRRSMEHLFNTLALSGQPALQPFFITGRKTLRFDQKLQCCPQEIFAHFHRAKRGLANQINSVGGNRRSKRCALHSLDSHRTRFSVNWAEAWAHFPPECRDELALVDAGDFMDALDQYLRKHRFCPDCKENVMEAYDVLVGNINGSCIPGFSAELYAGVRQCDTGHHIHVMSDLDNISDLIGRAQLDQVRGERHAKSIDVAQSEVLACLGAFLLERIQKVCQRMREEEHTWQLLFFYVAECLQRKFDMAVDQKQASAMYEEIISFQNAENRQKKQRKKKNKKKREAGSCCPKVTPCESMNSKEKLPQRSLRKKASEAGPSSPTQHSCTLQPTFALGSVCPNSPEDNGPCQCPVSIDPEQELRLLSSMGWSEEADDLSTTDDIDFSLTAEEIQAFKDKRLQFRKVLRERFNALSSGTVIKS
eukprot:m.133432 g.133432  ORF g.133432 m.133432 type:complete len:508 (-) comp23815_c0_seq2:156-1679(-)